LFGEHFPSFDISILVKVVADNVKRREEGLEEVLEGGTLACVEGNFSVNGLRPIGTGPLRQRR
jgi:hypothetical protein